MNLTRRRFGTLTASLLATTALAACATSTATTILISKFQTYAQDADNFIDGVVDAESLNGVLSAADVTTITGYQTTVDGIIAQILADATSAAATVSLTTAQGWVSGIETAVSDAVSLLQAYGVKIPTAVTTAITAVETVLPFLLAAVELSTVAAKRASASNMTLDQAQSVLATKPKL